MEYTQFLALLGLLSSFHYHHSWKFSDEVAQEWEAQSASGGSYSWFQLGDGGGIHPSVCVLQGTTRFNFLPTAIWNMYFKTLGEVIY